MPKFQSPRKASQPTLLLVVAAMTLASLAQLFIVTTGNASAINWVAFGLTFFVGAIGAVTLWRNRHGSAP